MQHVHWLIWLPIAASTVWNVGGFGAVFSLTRRRPELSPKPAPVTVLKPLCGTDPGLRDNLESFFRQDHPDFEIVFGVTDESDPALAIVRELAAAYPAVRAQVIVHAGQGALNPKVNNLLGMLPHASHDLVLLSDSNVQAPPHYVREMASVYERERPGLVTNLFAGVGECSLGATLENIGLSGFVAAGVGLPTALGDAVLVGKSVLFSRQALTRLGGLRRFSDVLAEDWVMAQMFVHAGATISVAPTVLANVTGRTSFAAMFARQLRWSMMRCRSHPVAYALEPVASPLALLPLAWLVLGPWALAWTCALLALRDVGGWLVLRGAGRWYLPLVLAPVRELLALAIWCTAPLKRHVAWRGKRFRMGAGTLLYQERGPCPRGSLRDRSPAASGGLAPLA